MKKRTLATDMARLVKRAKDLLPELGSEPHHPACEVLAHEFNLWDKDDQFPLWLSRVVEGEMNDLGIRS